MSSSAARQPLIVGTRGSRLARDQTQWVVDRIQSAHLDLEIRTEIITTTGDRQQGRPLPEIGGKGLFTEELEKALVAGDIDIAVHSAKDLPTALHESLSILGVPVREDPRDAWVSRDGTPFDDLEENAVVGTTSLRRQAQVLMRRSDATFVGLRGNVDTRIRKVQRGDCAGAVLAMAGLKRCGLVEHVTHPFEPEVMLPAPGQGALALEGRTGDDRVIDLLLAVHDEASAEALDCERAILAALDAGCRAPVAVLANVGAEGLRCEALVADPRGEQCIKADAAGEAGDGRSVVDQVVSQLRAGGADEIIAACRQE